MDNQSNPVHSIFEKIYSNGEGKDNLDDVIYEELADDERERLINSLIESFNFKNDRIIIDKEDALSIKPLHEISQNHNINIERLIKYGIILYTKNNVFEFYQHYNKAKTKKNLILRKITSEAFNEAFEDGRKPYLNGGNRIYHLTYAEALFILDADEIFLKRVSNDINACLKTFKSL